MQVIEGKKQRCISPVTFKLYSANLVEESAAKCPILLLAKVPNLTTRHGLIKRRTRTKDIAQNELASKPSLLINILAFTLVLEMNI